MTADTSNVPVGATVTTLRIIEHLHKHGECGVSEIAASLEKSKSTVHNHLQTLCRRNYLLKKDGVYQLGFRFLDFAGAIRTREPSFALIRQKVRELAERTGEICLFVIDDDGTAVVLFHERGDKAPETNIRFGKRIPNEQILAGEVITTTEQADLTEELGETKCRVGDEGFVQGLRSVAAPLTDLEGSLHGALSVTGPIHRFKDTEYEEQITDGLLNVVNELELDVSYSRY